MITRPTNFLVFSWSESLRDFKGSKRGALQPSAGFQDHTLASTRGSKCEIAPANTGVRQMVVTHIC